MIKIDQERLKSGGFTESGIDRYNDTLMDYGERVFSNSQSLGEMRKANGGTFGIRVKSRQ